MSLQRATSFGLACFASALCQQISKLDRGRAEEMLYTVSDNVAEAL